MADRSGPYRRDFNSTNYIHPNEENLFNLHKAMDYNDLGQPILRVSGGYAVATGTGGSDAFGRLKVAQPQTLFESQHRYDENDKFYTDTSGSGTTGYNVNSSSVDMTVTTASGDSVVRETKRVFPYQPGKALEIYNTFTMAPAQTGLRQRVGYFGTENGVYLEKSDNTLYWVLRTKTTGTVTETRVPQSQWNVDRLDGSGLTGYLNASGITLDTTKALIQYIDIEWLGVGTVRCGFIINGAFIIAHKFHHSNIGDSTYMTTAALPVRYEIENTGATASGASLEHICNSIISSGGFTPRGIQHVAGRGLTYYTASTAGTYYHLVSLRLDSDRLDDIAIPTDVSVLTDSNANLQFKLVSGATFATPLVWTNGTNSVETSVTDSAVTDQGSVLATRYIVNKGESRGFTREELEVLQLERDHNGAVVLSLIATAGSNNTTMTGNLGWIEPLRGT